MRSFAGFVPALLLGSALSLGPADAAAATRYVFATFLGDAAGAEKLSLYTSGDGLNFTLLANTGYGGPTGVLRDPTIMKHSDGKYYVAYTLQSWTTSSASFGIASSPDLLDWAFLVEVPAGIPDVRYTWAPEWFKDTDGIHLIVNLETVSVANDFRAYDFKASDDTLTRWDAPVPIGIGPNNIDTFVVKDGATYQAFSKNETSKFVERATAATLWGPWTWVGTGDWAGWGPGKEGVSLFRLDDGQWRMFLDCYTGCGFLYTTGSDLDTWSGTATVPGGLSGLVRHGTVLREEMDAESADASVGAQSADAGAKPAGAPASSGGCSMGSAGSRGGWVAALALALTLAARRRHERRRLYRFKKGVARSSRCAVPS